MARRIGSESNTIQAQRNISHTREYWRPYGQNNIYYEVGSFKISLDAQDRLGSRCFRAEILLVCMVLERQDVTENPYEKC